MAPARPVFSHQAFGRHDATRDGKLGAPSISPLAYAPPPSGKLGSAHIVDPPPPPPVQPSGENRTTSPQTESFFFSLPPPPFSEPAVISFRPYERWEIFRHYGYRPVFERLTWLWRRVHRTHKFSLASFSLFLFWRFGDGGCVFPVEAKQSREKGKWETSLLGEETWGEREARGSEDRRGIMVLVPKRVKKEKKKRETWWGCVVCSLPTWVATGEHRRRGSRCLVCCPGFCAPFFFLLFFGSEDGAGLVSP